jgi:hypothetical protein
LTFYRRYRVEDPNPIYLDGLFNDARLQDVRAWITGISPARRL